MFGNISGGAIRTHRLLVIAVVSLFTTGSANALCLPGFEIQGNLQYLVCINSEQYKAINELTKTVNDNADIAKRNAKTSDANVRDLTIEIRFLAREVEKLRSEIAEIRRVSDHPEP